MPTAEIKNPDRISIGFGLDGYVFETTGSTSSTPVVSTAGMLGFGGEVEVDGNYVADASLKQAFWELTYYQTFPLLYTENGEEKVAVYRDWTAMSDSSEKRNGYNVGSLSYGGACCPDFGPTYINASGSKTTDSEQDRSKSTSYVQSILQSCENLLQSYEGGARTDFVNGAAINKITLVPYFDHFYPSQKITWEQLVKLLKKGLLNAEILFRWGADNKGRAFRIKVVDGGPPFAKIDVMAAIFATSTFENAFKIAGTYQGRNISDARGAGFTFPFSSSVYDYKTGTIQGFSPAYIRSILPKVKFEFQGTMKSTMLSNFGRKVRVRLFIDENRKGDALALVPNLPDDLFKTNYEEGQEAEFGTSTSPIILTDDINQNIVKWAVQLDKFIKDTNLVHTYTFTYGYTESGACAGGGTFGLKSSYTELKDKMTIWSTYNGNWIFNVNAARDGTKLHTDCSHYVTWVLNECGITNQTSQLSSASINESMPLNSGYKCIKLGSVSDILPGDLLIWNKNGRHHAGIAAMQANNSMHYGMGATTYMTTTPNPHADPSANDFYRIIKTS